MIPGTEPAIAALYRRNGFAVTGELEGVRRVTRERVMVKVLR